MHLPAPSPPTPFFFFQRNPNHFAEYSLFLTLFLTFYEWVNRYLWCYRPLLYIPISCPFPRAKKLAVCSNGVCSSMAHTPKDRWEAKNPWLCINAAMQLLKTSVCYHHCFYWKSKTKHYVSLYKEINSISVKTMTKLRKIFVLMLVCASVSPSKEVPGSGRAQPKQLLPCTFVNVRVLGSWYNRRDDKK